MHDIFNIEGPVVRFFTKIVDAVWLSMLFIVCSLPIITIGASWSALYYAVHKNLKYDRSYPTREFFRAFKSGLKQGVCATLIFFPVEALMVWEALIMYNAAKEGEEVHHIYIFLLIAVFFIAMWMIYIFPYIARFSIDFKSLLRNSLIMAEGNIPTTVTLGIVLVIAFFLVGRFPILIIILPALYILLCDIFLEVIFRRYMSDEEREKEDLLNGGPDRITVNLEVAGRINAEKRAEKKALREAKKNAKKNS